MKADGLKWEIRKNYSSLPLLLKISKKIKEDFTSKKNEAKKIALLSNFTLKGLGNCLSAKSFLEDIFIDVYEGAYGQWQQEILGEEFYEFNPDLTFIILDAFGLDDDTFFNYHYSHSSKVSEVVEDYLNNLFGLIERIKERNKGKIIISNIPNHFNSITGIVSGKIKSNLRRLISEANISLENRFIDDNQVYIFDYDGWLGHIGKEKNIFQKYYFLGDMRIEPEAIPFLADQLLAYLIPLSSKTKKCLILDLDNTIWGGIVGEDGIEGIKLSPTGEGKPFYIFQKLILSLSKRGIILAINSKNNEEDVAKIFKKHPYMVLKEDNFAAMRINWQDKVSNIRELAEEINIGLDSMVFLDDDPTNREMVKEMLPEVEVVDLPKDPSLYWKTLVDYKGFSTFEYTDEDRKRGKMYFAERKRRDLKKKTVDIDSFLKNLNLKVEIKLLSEFDIPRASQLTQKTNQFNLTTKRYQEEDIGNFIKNKDKVWTLKAVDKFGDYGLTGVIIVTNKKDFWEIDTFLLSCRILGKKIEEQFIYYVLNELNKIESKKIIGKYIPTKKNMQVKDFYNKIGFIKSESADGEEEWKLELKEFKFIPINFIKFK